jgi:hypothetical protein
MHHAQAVRFVKALACLAVHFWALQYLPVEALEADWYHALSLPRKCAHTILTPAQEAREKERMGA